MTRPTLLCLVALAAGPLIHAADGTPDRQAKDRSLTKSASVTASGTIQAIDHTARLVTLKFDDGWEDTVYAGPEVKRFDELKVGDRIKLRYYESVVLQLRKPGEGSLPSGDEVKLTPSQKAVGATLARQTTMTVSVVAVDPKTPSITVKTADGRTVTRKVEDPKRLEGVKPGDRIDIVYTQAAVAEVEPIR